MSDRRAIWPDLVASRLVHEDDAMVVVDKPAGVPSQRARETGVADDLPTRLRDHLAARDGVDASSVYVGAHQRLDRATSGVIAYARRKEANKSLAAQFEGRAVEKRYVAAVVGLPAGPRRRTLEHRLADVDSGHIAVVPSGGKRAVTEVEVLERNGDRALVALVLETGRTHQARAQLAAIGAPIAGDRWYGGKRAEASAPRLLLHARTLGLAHPITGKRLEISAEPPRIFPRWMSRGDALPFAEGAIDHEVFDDALEVAREERFASGRAGILEPSDADRVDAFRLVNEDGDGVPGVSIDVYGDYLVASLYDEAAVAAREPILDALHGLGFDGVYVKVRPKQANVIVDSRREDLAPSRAVRGASADDEIELREHGIPYLARLGDGLSTGIFLDQRENRARVRAMAAGKRVLNLFAYTCPFTVAAAAGGASRTVSVDASAAAIERGRRGLAHAGLAGDHHAFVVEDVFAFLERAEKRGESFDLVILDPPSYSSVKGARFTTSGGASGYRPLAARAMRVVAKGGSLLACSNHRQTVQAKLRRLLHEAARDARRSVAQMKDLPPPVDFPAAWGREPHLKSIVVRLS